MNILELLDSNKLKFKKQTKKYELKHSDFLTFKLNDYNDYMINLKENPKTNRLDLSYLSIQPWKTLKHIISENDITDLINASVYECPFNGYKHSSLIPVSILTDNPIDYIKKYHGIEGDKGKLPWYSDMATDPTWNKDEHDLQVDQYMNSVLRVLLGSGYTQTFHPNDGHYDFSTVAMELENGDYILFIVIIWYNK